MLRRVTAEAPVPSSDDAEEAPRIVRRDKPQGLDGLRAEMQRKLAASMDLGEPDPTPEPVWTPPRNDARQRLETLRAEVQTFRTQPEARGLRAMLANLGGRRPRITRAQLVLILLALGAGGLAAVLSANLQASPALPVAEAAPVETIAAPPPAPVSRILVATQAIATGQRLSAAAMEWRDWPEDALRAEYVTMANAPEALLDMAGTPVRYPIFPGEPIRMDKLSAPGQGYLSAVLGAGMRAVSVSVKPDTASGGFIVPNDRVDVLVARQVGGQAVSETILTNVRVLAINSQLGETTAETESDPAAKVFAGETIATLELDARQAEIIAAGSTSGGLSLALRAMDDFSSAEAERADAVNAAIRMTSPFWTQSNANTPQ